jgi:predicted nucleic acid-binding protein
VKNRAVLDSGPLIHLNQVNRLEILNIVEEKIISREVADEIGSEIRKEAEVEIKELNSKSKDNSKYISNKHNIELGEATAISLAQQLDTKLILTDDLDARTTAKKLDLEPHGTIGAVTRAYKEDILDIEKAKKTIDKLQKNSSLFLTTDLVKWAKNQIEKN